MLKELKEKFPQWTQDKTTEFDLLLSDDIDSLMCYIFQKIHFNRECKYYIDVNYKKATPYNSGIQKLYKAKDYTNKTSNIIGLDIALDGNMKCWDNHITKISYSDRVNENSANINIVKDICQYNYTKKYVVSSFITMLSYYGADITKWTKDQLSVLCAIDGLYCPFISNFKAQGKANLMDLEYEFLAEFITNNINYIQELESQLNLKKGKIKVNDNGYLTTDIDLLRLSEIFYIQITLPDIQFTEFKSFKSKIIKLNYGDSKEIFKDKLFNFALHYKNSCFASLEI